MVQRRYSNKSLKIPNGGNQNRYMEEEQTTQWPKEKVQKDKQRSTKHTYKTKDRVTFNIYNTMTMKNRYLSLFTMNLKKNIQSLGTQINNHFHPLTQIVF